jgi:hypothetical protein
MLIDIHTHLGLGLEERDLIGLIKERGVDQIWTSALEGGYYPTADDVRRSNQHVHNLMSRRPNHVVGFCYVNPAHGKQALAELRHNVEENGFRGVKLWVATTCHDPRVDPIVAYAVDHQLPILVHAWAKVGGLSPSGGNLPFESTPTQLGILADRFPAAKLIMAHLGGNWQYGVQVARDHPNIWVDTSGSIAEMDSIQTLIRNVGSERVCFGTDNSDLDYCLGKIQGAGLTDAQREAVLWRNAKTLLATS